MKVSNLKRNSVSLLFIFFAFASFTLAFDFPEINETDLNNLMACGVKLDWTDTKNVAKELARDVELWTQTAYPNILSCGDTKKILLTLTKSDQVFKKAWKMERFRQKFARNTLLLIGLCEINMHLSTNLELAIHYNENPAAAISHGGRLNLGLVGMSASSVLRLLTIGDKKDFNIQKSDLYDQTDGVLDSRAAATHDLTFDGVDTLVETRPKFLNAVSLHHHKKVDVSFGGFGNLGGATTEEARRMIFFMGSRYGKDGLDKSIDHGSVYIFKKNEWKPTTHGALLIGTEPSAPGTTDQYKTGHGMDAVSSDIAVTGGQKFRLFPENNPNFNKLPDTGGLTTIIEETVIDQTYKLILLFDCLENQNQFTAARTLFNYLISKKMDDFKKDAKVLLNDFKDGKCPTVEELAEWVKKEEDFGTQEEILAENNDGQPWEDKKSLVKKKISLNIKKQIRKSSEQLRSK